MSSFPINFFQSIIQWGLSTKFIDKQKIKKIKKFFSNLIQLNQEKIKELEKEDYISEFFSKEEFLSLYCLYLNKHLIKMIQKTNSFFVLDLNSKKYLVISLPLDRFTY